eukprot:6189400-Pleurochrysis_carterae.AAC.1
MLSKTCQQYDPNPVNGIAPKAVNGTAQSLPTGLFYHPPHRLTTSGDPWISLGGFSLSVAVSPAERSQRKAPRPPPGRGGYVCDGEGTSARGR